VNSFEVFLSAFGGSAATLVVAAYLGRRFLDIQVVRAIEKYKAELEQKSSILKTELSIYAHEQNVGISRIDQQRSDAIRSIYGLAMRWHEILLEITKPNEPRMAIGSQAERYRGHAKALVKAAEEISVTTRDYAIFFQQSSYEVVSRFGMAAMDLSCAFYDRTFGSLPNQEGGHDKELMALIQRERKTLTEESRGGFEAARSLLIQEFRILMKAERDGSEPQREPDAEQAGVRLH
jgi:hypothetical protein